MRNYSSIVQQTSPVQQVPLALSKQMFLFTRKLFLNWKVQETSTHENELFEPYAELKLSQVPLKTVH